MQVLQIEVDDDIIEEDVGLEAGVVVGVDRDGGGTGGTVVEVFDVGQRLEKTSGSFTLAMSASLAKTQVSRGR